MKQQAELETLILKTLSLFDYYSLERLLVEFDEIDLLGFPNFSRPDLEILLFKLTKSSHICEKSINGEVYWKKNFPARKSFFHKRRFKVF